MPKKKKTKTAAAPADAAELTRLIAHQRRVIQEFVRVGNILVDINDPETVEYPLAHESGTTTDDNEAHMQAMEALQGILDDTRED